MNPNNTHESREAMVRFIKLALIGLGGGGIVEPNSRGVSNAGAIENRSIAGVLAMSVLVAMEFTIGAYRRKWLPTIGG